MTMWMRLPALLLGLVALLDVTLLAGGPLRVVSGTAVIWNATNVIAYKIDKGPLGVIPEADVSSLVGAAFDKWAKVPTAALSFSQGSLGEDVDSLVRLLQLRGSTTSGSVMVSDSTGDIVEGVFGVGSKANVLGFAEPMFNTPGSQITRFVAVMNGTFSSNLATISSTLVHEFGHALGLDHSQINWTVANDGDTANDRFLPTMFPTSSDDDTPLIDLNPDDEAWISRLYPRTNFASSYGTITGSITRGGSPVLGANVLAIAVTDGNDDMLNRFSCVSDYLMTSNGRFDLHVPPGEYKIRVEPIVHGFYGGSSVGPYAEHPSSPSFKNPVKNRTYTTVYKVAAGATVNIGPIVAQ
jgi:hypothetical protein